ncbi:flagellar hook-associated protein FlgL [Planctomycetes bacterium MalM25]|nr:flagellar hook-associated protein FlgL [Planctomycetes bacterium MalM25]
MATIQPIATSRVTDAMTRGRLTAQIQNDQRELFRLQNQLSTGFRIFLPSDDASAAQRAMALQRTLERKEQAFTNINGAVASLATTESALSGVGTSLNELKSQALSVVDSITDENDRQAVINAIDGLLFDLTRAGNSTFASNYLLGGAERASEAYQGVQTYVEYLGDESSPQTFVDIGQLFDTGVAGDEVLGGLSESIRGVSDLNVQLTPETRLSDLNDGVGVTPNGSIEITYTPTTPTEPTTSSIVDLSNAKTIDDVARLIETSAPEGSVVTVSIENNALRLDTFDGGLQIEEVAGGVAASELGVLYDGAPATSVNGTDLDPILRQTTRLDDLAGAKARGRLELPGANNDLVLTANANGASLNSVNVEFVDGATAGSESATYVSGTNTLTVTIAASESNTNQIAAAITAEGTFTAEPDYFDQTAFAARGTGDVSAAVYAAATAGGVDGPGGAANGDIDLASGLQVTNGAETYVIDTSRAETLEDLMSLLNDPNYGMVARINDTGDGIDVRTRRSGADFSIGENGGTTATDLGIRSYTEESRLVDFNRGVGVVEQFPTDTETRAQNELIISGQDGGTTFSYSIDPVELSTVEDLFDRIATDTGGAFTADLATTGNGIVLTRNDVVDPAVTATGTVGLGGDTLTFTANTPGAAGNNPDFTIEVVDNASGGLSTTVNGDVITVDLGGSATETSATVAASITTALPGYTVTEGLAAPVTVPEGPNPFAVAGGFDADTFTVTGDMAERLGFLPEGESSVTSTGASVTSADRNPHEVDSVYTTLIRMREALEIGDSEALGREINRLEEDIDRVTAGRAEVGVRLRNLESIEQRLTDEEVTLREALSDEIDADLVEVISDFTAKQASLQASLQTSGALLGLSILDFI